MSIPIPAFTAQNATVVVEDAPVRSKPTQDAAVLEVKKLGAPIRISSNNREGWFKTRTGKGVYGWIWQADVLIPSSKSDIGAANLDFKAHERVERKPRKQPWFFIRGGGEFLLAFNGNVSRKLGLGMFNPYPTIGGYGEIAVRVDENLRLALRLSHTTGASTATYTSAVNQSVTTYSITHSSTPILLGLDADVFRGESWDFGSGIYVGGATNTMKIQATSAPSPNNFTLSQFNYAALINFTGRYRLSKHWSIISDFGAHIAPTTVMQIPNAFNGSAPFLLQNGALGKVRATQVGPYLTAGLQLAL